MLSKISWGQFGLAMLVVTVVFYMIVLGKFYRTEIAGLFSPKKKKPAQASTPGPGAAPASGSAQRDLSSQPVGDKTPELYKVMEKVIGQLKQEIERAVAYKVPTPELTDHIKAILGQYRQLKRTPYQISINNYLERICSTNFSLVLDESALEGLWG